MIVKSTHFNVTGNFDQLSEYCSKMSDLLVKNANHLDDVMATLDVNEHSIGYLTVL